MSRGRRGGERRSWHSSDAGCSCVPRGVFLHPARGVLASLDRCSSIARRDDLHLRRCKNAARPTQCSPTRLPGRGSGLPKHHRATTNLMPRRGKTSSRDHEAAAPEPRGIIARLDVDHDAPPLATSRASERYRSRLSRDGACPLEVGARACQTDGRDMRASCAALVRASLAPPRTPGADVKVETRAHQSCNAFLVGLTPRPGEKMPAPCKPAGARCKASPRAMEEVPSGALASAFAIRHGERGLRESSC